MEQKSKLQIIEETVKFYTENPSQRATDKHDYCEYITTDGRRCAVGRYMIDPSKFAGSSGGSVHYIANIEKRTNENCPVFTQEDLIEEVRGHNWSFWAALQGFHDSPINWKLGELTEEGINHVERLKKDYGTDSEG